MSTMRASIRRSLLRWVLAGSMLVLALSVLVAAVVARRTADQAYDQALYAVAADIASTVRLRSDGVELIISDQSETFVRTDEVDQLFFCVRDLNGLAIGGDRDMPIVRVAHPSMSLPAYFRDRPVQILTAAFERGGLHFTVTVAETTRKRSELFGSMVTSLLAPLLMLLLLAVAVVVWSVRRGLQPLTVLERQIAARGSDDLSPIDESYIPQEAASLGDALNRLLGQLRHATDRQRRFVADAAHQLRTPLASMQAQVDALSAAPSVAELHAGMPRLSAAVRRMVRLTHQLLALARAEPGASAVPGNVSRVDLAAVVQRGADEWFHRALSRQIDLGFELDPAEVRGDAAPLGELVSNLVDNALLYTPPGGTVTVSTGGEGVWRWLRVDDSGPGVAPQEAHRVFERFYRGQVSADTEGSGLGLAIAKELADTLGATIAVLTSPHGGARFELRVPAG